jgi:hypothetical protein
MYGGTALQEFLPKWVQGDYLKPEFLEKQPVPENRLITTSGDLTCENYSHTGTSYEYSFKASTDSEARLALFYWPGWELSIDGKLQSHNIRPDDKGLILISVPAGTHRVELRYALSSEGKAARVLASVAALVWLSILLWWIFSQWQTYLRRQRRSEIGPITSV